VPTTNAPPSRLATVPPFPPVAAQLLRTLGDDSVNLREIASLVASDATLCARVLQYANSAEFTLIDPVRNVRQALAVLGFDRTRKLTVTLAAAAYSGAALRASELRRCWRHMLATAVLSEEIAKRCGLFVETAYTAGMMHDIGRLGLLVAYPRQYEETIRNAAERCLDLLDFERETFGIDHAEAGRWLAERWRLPSEFRVIAGRHHDTPDGGPASLLKIVHVACRLADYFGYDVTRPLQPQPMHAVLADLPEHTRAALLRDREILRAAVESTIFSHDETESESGRSESLRSGSVDDTFAGTDAADEQFLTELMHCCTGAAPEPVQTAPVVVRLLRALRNGWRALFAR
jgi:putative nucleotidyltransferase with HDIG domain